MRVAMKIKEIRTDNLVMFSFFTLVALVLLFPFGYWVGVTGFMIISILLSIAVFIAFSWAKGIGRSFTNGGSKTLKKDKEAMIITMVGFGYSAYLSWGLHELTLYLHENIEPKPVFYFWLFSFSAPILTLMLIRSYKAYPILSIINNRKRMHQQELALKKQQIEQESYEFAILALEKKYQMAINPEVGVDDYIKLSETIAKRYKNKVALSQLFANYTTKLMIKYTEIVEPSIAHTIFNSYVGVIAPHVGLSDKSSDVASMGIYISIMLSNSNIFNQVTENILGKNINVIAVNNKVLHFNIACYYALNQNKPKLLMHTLLTRRQGKSMEGFLSDSDFNDYLNDKEFLDLVHNPS
jgi:hypothetical protein